VSGEVTSAFSLGLPALWPLTMLGSAIFVVLPCLFIVAFARSYRALAPVALVLPALLVAALYVGSDSMTAAQLVARTAFFTLLTFALWRHGVVAAIIAAFVGMSLDGVTQLARSGNSDLVLPAVLAAALVALPAVLAVLAWREANRRAPQPGRA
jgi:hypothetical protein